MINISDFVLYSEHFEGPTYLYWIEYSPTEKRKLIEKETALRISKKFGLRLISEREYMRNLIEKTKAEKEKNGKEYRH